MPVVNGTTYDDRTDKMVIDILEHVRRNKIWVILHYGFTHHEGKSTGKDWNEENDVTGTINRSSGRVKVPLIICRDNSSVASPISTDCIVRIRTVIAGVELYKHPAYHQGVFSVRAIQDDEMVSWSQPPCSLKSKGFNYAVDVDGVNYANFRTLRAARIFVRRMTGQLAQWQT